MGTKLEEDYFTLTFENYKVIPWKFDLNDLETLKKYINDGLKDDENNTKSLVGILSKLLDEKEKNIEYIILIINSFKNIKNKLTNSYLNSPKFSIIKDIYDIEELIKKAQNKNSVDKAIELMEKNNLIKNKNYCKEILKIAFKEKGTALIKILCEKFNIDLSSNNEDLFLDELIKAALYNTSQKPETVFVFLLEQFPEKINELDIDELFKAYKNNKTNVVLGRYFIKKLSEKNNPMLKCTNMKDYEDLIKSIIRYSNNVELFEKYYYEYKTNYSTKYKSNITSFLKEIFINGKKKDPKDEESIIDCVLKNESNLPSNLLEKLLKIDKAVDIELLNKVISKSNPSKLQNTIEITKIGKQGEGQIKKIDRNITYNGNSIKTIKDTVIANLIDGTEKKLYKVTYDNEGNQEIIYYEENEEKILAIIKIDKDGDLKFESEKEGKKATYNSDEIKRILNDNYNGINYFDYKLSFLSYITLKNEDNISFKTNCNKIEDIVGIVKNNKNPKKITICDFSIDKHNIQIIIGNNSINILNTSPNFEYVRKEIEEKCNGVEVKQIKTTQQSENNCVEASKLYTVVLIEKYKQNFKNLENLSERLNKFKEFMEDILNKTEEEQVNYIEESEKTKKEYDENVTMLKTVLETNVELFNKYKKHFKDSVEELKKIELKIEMISILNLKNKINNKLKVNDNKYKDIINYIINNTKEISENKEINKIEALRKSKILLKIIKNNTKEESIRIKNKKIDKVNDILENKQNKSTEQIFLECIEKIGDSTAKELGF